MGALEAVEALGRTDKDLAALLARLTLPAPGAKRPRGGGGGGEAGKKASTDYWAVQSALEAVDLVLWSFVDQPEGGWRGWGQESDCLFATSPQSMFERARTLSPPQQAARLASASAASRNLSHLAVPAAPASAHRPASTPFALKNRRQHA